MATDPPASDGLDLRWSSDYQFIVTSWPAAEPALWSLLGAAWDQGAREHATKPNPFWAEDPKEKP